MAIEGQRKGNEARGESNPETRRPLKHILGGAVLTGALAGITACGGSAQQAPATESGYTEMRANPDNRMNADAQPIPVNSMGGRGVTNPWTAGETEDAGSEAEANDAEATGGRGFTNPWNSGNSQDAGTPESDAGEAEDAGSEAEGSSGGRGFTNPWTAGSAQSEPASGESDVRERMEQIVEGCQGSANRMRCIEDAALAEDEANRQDAGTSESDAGEADAGGRGYTNPWTEGQKQAASINCNGLSTTVAAGQEVWFSVSTSELPTWKFKITEVTNETVTTDITMSVMAAEPSINTASFRITFNGVEIPRSKIGELGDALCQAVGEVREAAERAGEDPDAPLVVPDLYGDHAGPLEGLYGAFGMTLGEDLGSLLREALVQVAAFGRGEFPQLDEKVRFSVVSSDEQEFVLKIEGGRFDGQTFRLDRKIDINIEFLFEQAGYFVFTHRIEALSVDQQGEVSATVSIDVPR